MKNQFSLRKNIITVGMIFLLVPSITLAEIPKTLGELITPVKDGFWKETWENTRISFDLTPISVNKTIVSGMSAGFSMNYRYNTEPAYVRSYHLRSDAYDANIGLSKAISDIGLGASLSAKVTFVRLFKEKRDAIEAKPYFLNRFPWDSERAKSELNPGDVVRVDMGVGIGASAGVGSIFDGVAKNASVGINRGSSLIVDVYRLRGNAARVRFIATRALGSASFSAAAAPLGFFNFAVGAVNRWLSRYVKLNILTAAMSGTPIEDLPTETYMADYIFNFDTKEGTDAYNFVMEEFRSLKYVSILNFQMADQSISGRLVLLVKKAEDAHALDIEKPTKDRAVIRIFKGTMSTNFHSLSFSSNAKFLLNVWNRNYSDYMGHSITQGWNENNERVDLFYSSRLTTDNYNAIQDFISSVEYNGIETAYNANLSDSNQKPTPTSLSDLYLYRNISDANLKADKIKHEMASLKFISPFIFNQIDWGNFVDGQDKQAAYLNTSIVVHQEAMQSMPKMTMEEISQKLKELADRYPYTVYLADTSRPENDPARILFIDSLSQLKKSLYIILNTTDIDEKIKTFEKLKLNEMFKTFGSAFLLSIIPESKLSELVLVKINAAAKDGTKITFKFGEHELSSTYSSFQAMNAVLNDRSFDLRIQVDNAGKLKAYKSNETCNNCDGF